jgi:hypothetical protein
MQAALFESLQARSQSGAMRCITGIGSGMAGR